MRVINKTQDIVLSENASLAESFMKRLRGLMLSGPSDLVLVSPKESSEHSSIHMFFMKYPIDVVWLDSEFTVVDVKRNVKPSRLFRPKTWFFKPSKQAKYVVELGRGSAKETRIGDCMALV